MHAPLPEPPTRETILRVLRERFGFEEFRPGQERVVRALLDGRDVLTVFPTGAGKSLLFQLVSQLVPGVTIVVSPLLALMHDQSEFLTERGIDVAVITGQLSETAADEELGRVQRLEAPLLYITPERFLNAEFLAAARELPVSLLVVDEAHCISEWGHSFRPAYLALETVARQLGRPTILALTATATPWVRRDIVERLGMRDPDLFVRDSDRPNLFLEVQRIETEEEEYRALRRLFTPEDDDAEPLSGSGIVYTATTRGASETAEWLQSWGIAADYYHGQRSKRDRIRVQDQFMDGTLQVIAATNAFGLGVDKPDIRFVVHRDVPGSLEEYYQEAGRAGRDGERARCLLLYRPAGLGRAAFLSAGGRLDRDDLARVCAILQAQSEIAPSRLRKASGLGQATLLRVLATLEHEELIGRRRGRIRLLKPEVDPEAVSLEAEERRRAYEKSRLDMMRRYAELGGCRREYLLNYFGEEYDPADCRMCDNSLARPSAAAERPAGPFAVGDAVRHDGWGEGIVERVTADSVTVLFDNVGFKTLDLTLALERSLLAPVGSASSDA